MRRLTAESLHTVQYDTQAQQGHYKSLLMVCTGTGCVAAKGLDMKHGLERILEERGLGKDFLVVGTGCNGFCAQGPILVVQPEGIFYQKLDAKGLERIVEEHLVGGEPVEDYLFTDPSAGVRIPRMTEIPFFRTQQPIALRNRGWVDPERIESAIARGGYRALAKALHEMQPGDVLSAVKRSALRGRGGGGFPTGLKWEGALTAATEAGVPPYIVCNADEGDPGAFMDRSIIESDPHAVLEGMALGAFAVGAREGFVYIRQEYPLALRRLTKAIQDARLAGCLGENILGSGFAFDIQVHRGAGAFVCGESSALMASMSGRPGEPRDKYVHNVEQGYRDKPTVLNNVETWANIPVIIEKGGEWFASIGTGGDLANNPWAGSSGTKVFSLVGAVRNTGLVEVPMGIPLREIIFDIGGGISDGGSFKAVQTGGPSGGCLPASFLDAPVDFDTLTRAGSMMGSGGMIVMDEGTCMVDVAKYFVTFLKDESCGKCTPCREGLAILHEILSRISRGEGTRGDLDALKSVSETMREASLCQLGKSAPNPVLTTLEYFREEYGVHVDEKRCPAGVCKDLITYTINENCTGCHLCFRHCPVSCISG
ncbi:MAG: NADH-ubiquinone oxidoreductase-F iron-sulfur binding region domain-containing protein, partial [Planctomycetota bacterium]